ncbi:MAG: alpha/beta hydrolase [Chloroflexota bacterium]|nr:alpha/beta hydrolase [Chloroflexota bacterium]
MSQTEPNDVRPGHFIQVNDLEIYYEEYGRGEPLILLHGGTATLQSWQDQIPAFAEHFRVVALDSRGHGKTINPAGELRYDQMADDVAAFIGALDLEKPLVFGYSDGGQVALELGMRYPDLGGALVLGGTCYRFPPQYFQALQGFGVDKPENFDPERLQADQPEWVDYLKAQHVRANDPDYWRTFMKQIAVLWWNVRDYAAEDLQKITAPTLILQGDRDEGVDVEQAVEMYRGIPNAELAVLPNATHGQLGEIANTIVIDFLKRHQTQVLAA